MRTGPRSWQQACAWYIWRDLRVVSLVAPKDGYHDTLTVESLLQAQKNARRPSRYRSPRTSRTVRGPGFVIFPSRAGEGYGPSFLAEMLPWPVGSIAEFERAVANGQVTESELHTVDPGENHARIPGTCRPDRCRNRRVERRDARWLGSARDRSQRELLLPRSAHEASGRRNAKTQAGVKGISQRRALACKQADPLPLLPRIGFQLGRRTEQRRRRQASLSWRKYHCDVSAFHLNNRQIAQADYDRLRTEICERPSH